MKKYSAIKTVILLYFFLHVSSTLFSQCDPTVPTFTVDLSNSPNGTWYSPDTVRVGNCCTDNNCVKFVLYLSPNAVAIQFDHYSGAWPSGSLFYQINCGPLQPVGQPICLAGPGPYTLTFCKPGNNPNVYYIQSIARPAVSPDDTTGTGCNVTMHVSGLLIDSTIHWNSVSPGAFGAYNSYLSCQNGCDSSVVTPGGGSPAFIDYQVCGKPAGGVCAGSSTFCDTVRVYVSPPLTATVVPNPAVYCADTTGILLNATPGGGLPAYTSSWTNGANGTGSVVGAGTIFTATAAGNYSYIVYDHNYPKCPPTITNVSVSISPIPVVNAGPDQILCGPSATLSASFSGSTGVMWSGGLGTFSPNASSPNAVYTPTTAELAIGIVTLTLSSTGNGACVPRIDQVVLSFPTPVSATFSATAVGCNGGTNGSATVTASAGTPGYTYTWTPFGGNSPSAGGLSAGTYTCIVKDANGCLTNTIVAITQPAAALTASVSATASVSCFGNATGASTITASGGTPSYSYTWAPTGGNNSNASGFSAGSYTCFITDINGCATNQVVSITQPAAPLASSVSSITNVSCNGGNNGSSTISTSGGTPSYSYTWVPSGGNGSTASGLSAGTYTCLITDANGCFTNTVVTITEPAAALASGVSSTTSVSCNGGNNGASSVTVSGGTPSYSYTWSPVGGNSASASGLFAGTYTCFITDANGCTTNTVVTIGEPASPLTLTVAVTASISCNGGNNGSTNASVSGGTPSYTYTWAPSGGNSASASGLAAGNYTCFVTDANGCISNTILTISEPTVLTATISPFNNVSCFGGSDGSATASVSGGTPAYSYTWFPTGGNGQVASGLSAGSYSCIITDANGCPATNTIVATINQPSAPLSASVSSTTSVSCNGGNNGASTITASGGTPSYSYTWAPSGGNGVAASGLSAGTYTCFITDVNGCTTNAVVAINQPATALTASVSATTTVSCNGGNNGASTVSPSGGTPSYSYTWSPAGGNSASATNLSAQTYTCFITDANGCTTNTVVMISQPVAPLVASISATSSVSCNGGNNGSATISANGGTLPYSYSWNTAPIQTNATASGLTAGTYTCSITDANGCATNTVVTISQPPILTASISATSNVSCNGGNNGFATTSVSGGVGPYSYTWAPTGGNGVTASGLIANTYSCFITDANGCPCTNTVVVNITQPLTPLAVTNTTSVPGCNGGTNGSASVGTAGGTPPYTITWSTNPVQMGNTAINLSAGSYTATIVDSLSCQAVQDVIVTDLPMEDSLAIDAVLCLQGRTYVVTAPSGGTPPNAIGPPYQWYYTNNPIGGATASSYTASYQPNSNNYSVTWFYHGCRYVTTNLNETIYQDITVLPQTNIFTPNADAVNDDFFPLSMNQANPLITYQEIVTLVDDYELLVYDRWGELLFHTNKVLEMWSGMATSGEQAADGTYYWIAKYKTKCSSDYQKLKGFVQLLR